jgi:hypothetical protein
MIRASADKSRAPPPCWAISQLNDAQASGGARLRRAAGPYITRALDAALYTATVSEEEQRVAVERNYPMFSKPDDA